MPSIKRHWWQCEHESPQNALDFGWLELQSGQFMHKFPCQGLVYGITCEATGPSNVKQMRPQFMPTPWPKAAVWASITGSLGNCGGIVRQELATLLTPLPVSVVNKLQATQFTNVDVNRNTLNKPLKLKPTPANVNPVSKLSPHCKAAKPLILLAPTLTLPRWGRELVRLIQQHWGIG